MIPVGAWAGRPARHRQPMHCCVKTKTTVIFEMPHRDLISGTLRRFEVLFDLVITAQDVRSYKSADKHIRRFLELTKVRPENWIYAAVSNEYDLVPGHALGANCIWINRDDEVSQKTDFLLANLNGMAALPATTATYLERDKQK
jgi:hypothetical protein